MKCRLLDAGIVPYPMNTTKTFFVTKTTTKKSEIRSPAQIYELRFQMFPPILKLEDYENALTFFKNLNCGITDNWAVWCEGPGMGCWGRVRGPDTSRAMGLSLLGIFYQKCDHENAFEIRWWFL